MSQNPDEPRENAPEDAGFESGLDYGAFAADEPDYPEDHFDSEPAESADAARSSPEESAPSSEPAAGAPAPRAASPEDVGEQPTTVVPPVREDDNATRSLSEELAAAESASSGERADAGDPATQRSPADTDEPRTAAVPAGPAPAGVGQSAPPQPREESVSGSASADYRESPADRDPVPAAVPSASSPVRSGQAKHAAAPPDDAEIREEAERDKRGVSRFFTVLIAIFTPILFIVLAIRLVASPLFLMFTYWRPGFPEDAEWGLSDRLLYGSYGTDFLLNAADSRYLAELAPGGEPLFTDAEVSHMADVKILLWYVMIIGVVLLLITLLLALLLRAWRPGGFARGIFAGAWVTLGLMAGLAVLAIIDWQLFFTEFHNLFFPQGNWAFSADSTLIRLYPEQFWIDAGIWLAALVLLFVLIALLVTWPTKRRRARRAERLAEVHERRRAKLEDELTKAAAES